MAEITTIPAEFSAGDTLNLSKEFSDYPASEGWVCKYTFVSKEQQINVTGTADGDAFSIVLSAAVSATMDPGLFSYQGYVEKDSERYTVDTGTTTVLANLADASSGYDARDHIRKTLDAIEAVIEGRASSAQASRKVGDRELKYIPLTDLIKIREQYKEELYEQEQALKQSEGETVNKNIGFMFTRIYK